MERLLLPRRCVLAGMIAAPIIRMRSANAWAQAAATTHSSDYLAQILKAMAVGQWKRISGPVGNVVKSIVPFTRANFDGYGTGKFGTFSSGADIGTLNAANLFAYSKGGIDTRRLKIAAAGGGHVAYQDGSFRTFDIQAACAAVLRGRHGTWVVGAMPPKLWPITDRKPPSSVMYWGGQLNSTVGSGQASQTTLTVADAKKIAIGDFINQAKVKPTAISIGTRVNGISGTTLRLSQPLQATISNVAINTYAGTEFWAGASATNQTMMVSSHTYHACNPVPGRSQWLLGGTFGDFSNNARPGRGFVFDDKLPDGSNVVTDAHQGIKGYFDSTPSDFCDLDRTGALYYWHYYSQSLSRTNPPYPCAAENAVLATHLDAAVPPANAEGLIVPDVVNGPGRRMFWAHFGNQVTPGGFGVILNMYPQSGATYTNRPGTYTSNPSSFWSGNTEGLTFCYNKDKRYIAGYDYSHGTGHIQSITIDSSLRATVSNIFARPSGDIPGNTGYARIAYDTAHKCFIVQQTGDVYLVKLA